VEVLRLGHELDAEYPGVELEARYAEVVWDVNLVEAAPEPRQSLQWEGGHNLHRPDTVISAQDWRICSDTDHGPLGRIRSRFLGRP